MIAVEGLTIADERGRVVIEDVSYSVEPGRSTGLVGESGSGKTTTGLALLGRVRPGLRLVAGRVLVNGTDVLRLPDKAQRAMRRTTFAYLGQDPAASLTPSMRVGALLAELAEGKPTAADLLARLEAVGLPASEGFLRRYPHQMSGGQRQRVALARALVNRPQYVLLDEPTTGLDTTTQRLVLDELERARDRDGFAMVIISHDLGVVARFADAVLVMRDGRVVEQGLALDVLTRPQHHYTTRLVEVSRALGRSDGRRAIAQAKPPVVRVSGLVAGYDPRQPGVRDVTFGVAAGESVALVGSSGSGKTTIARCLIGLHAPTQGSIELLGEQLAPTGRRRAVEQRRLIQLVPQDPGGSLNPRRSVGATIARPLRLLRGFGNPGAIGAEVERLLGLVHLDPRVAQQRPGSLSGGQRQRVAIARALAADPAVLVCDEITSALDVSVQDAVLGLVTELRDSLGLAVVFIAHDLGVVRQVAHRVLVLDQGEVCEEGAVDEVLDDPRHERTKALVDASISLEAVLDVVRG